MAKRTRKPKPESAVEVAEDGEQLPLIDVAPENAKDILRVARSYKRAQAVRNGALAEEVKLKQKLLALVHESGVSADHEGGYRLSLNGVVVTVKPRDELVRVKDKDDDGQDHE